MIRSQEQTHSKRLQYVGYTSGQRCQPTTKHTGFNYNGQLSQQNKSDTIRLMAEPILQMLSQQCTRVGPYCDHLTQNNYRIIVMYKLHKSKEFK